MTNQGDDGDIDDGNPAVREQLLSRTCAWCGAPVRYSGVGRPPRFCSAAHRQREYELRTAQARADAATASGARTVEPVREVVLRAVPSAPEVHVVQPTTPQEWDELLRHLGRDAPAGASPQWRRRLANAAASAAERLRAQPVPDTDTPQPRRDPDRNRSRKRGRKRR